MGMLKVAQALGADRAVGSVPASLGTPLTPRRPRARWPRLRPQPGAVHHAKNAGPVSEIREEASSMLEYCIDAN